MQLGKEYSLQQLVLDNWIIHEKNEVGSLTHTI